MGQSNHAAERVGTGRRKDGSWWGYTREERTAFAKLTTRTLPQIKEAAILPVRRGNIAGSGY